MWLVNYFLTLNPVLVTLADIARLYPKVIKSTGRRVKRDMWFCRKKMVAFRLGPELESFLWMEIMVWT